MKKKIESLCPYRIFFAFSLLLTAVIAYASSPEILQGRDKNPEPKNSLSKSVVNINRSVLPKIEKLSHKDLTFVQLEEARTYNDIAAAGNKEQLIEFYTYVPQKNDTMLTLASSTGIPYDTIASLNGITGSKMTLEGKPLIIPSVKGLFIYAKPKSELEILCAKEIESEGNPPDDGTFIMDGMEIYFFLGRRFTSTQRAFFLDSSIRMPLRSAVVSSAFGFRHSPVYGKWKFHKGIDFAAPEGEPVFACKSGTVSVCIRDNAVFGNYIVINHGGGMTSTYAHLSQIKVKKGDFINGGTVIGNVGKTGAATGSHLHFEIRLNGTAQDPAKLLPL